MDLDVFAEKFTVENINDPPSIDLTRKLLKIEKKVVFMNALLSYPSWIKDVFIVIVASLL